MSHNNLAFVKVRECDRFISTGSHPMEAYDPRRLGKIKGSPAYSKPTGVPGYYSAVYQKSLVVRFTENPSDLPGGVPKVRLRGFFTSESRENAGYVVLGKQNLRKVRCETVEVVPDLPA
jgi:hypothetical protein